MNIAPGLRAALIAEPTISGLLSLWNGEPAVFTRVPVPDSSVEPMIVIGQDISVTDIDALSAGRPVIVRDIFVYGQQPDHHRLVETVAYAIRELFHRNRFSFSVTGYHVVQVIASGPRLAPTDDDSTVGRVVTLTVTLRKQP